MRSIKFAGLGLLALLPAAAAFAVLLVFRWVSALAVPHSTTTFNTSLPTIVEQIRDLNRLETASFQAQKIVEAHSSMSPIPGWLVGDRVLLVAQGSVTAGVDLAALSSKDVRIAGGVTHVRLPHARIFAVRLDERSYVYDHHPGVLGGLDPQLESEARQKAVDEIRGAAISGGVLARADDSARRSVSRLLHFGGVPKVVFDS